ncbi:MAG: hypothetical protein L6V80_06800 [Bacteroidales bacterium]|nr:MAG: hypothetical protein L6V80_06800 [Bacteroidales bacterium]
MKEQNQNESTVDVELLKSQLLHRKITIGRFRLPYSYEQTKDMLLAAYQAEVEYRCRHFTTCEEFESQREQIARFLTGNSEKFGLFFAAEWAEMEKNHMA